MYEYVLVFDVVFLTKVSEHYADKQRDTMNYQLRHFIFITMSVVHRVTRGDVAALVK